VEELTNGAHPARPEKRTLVRAKDGVISEHSQNAGVFLRLRRWLAVFTEPVQYIPHTDGMNWTVIVRCAADSALSKQQRQQFSATTECAKRQDVPQPRRMSCNGLSLYGFCGDATAYAETLWLGVTSANHSSLRLHR
jgi:hypothetical protein